MNITLPWPDLKEPLQFPGKENYMKQNERKVAKVFRPSKDDNPLKVVFAALLISCFIMLSAGCEKKQVVIQVEKIPVRVSLAKEGVFEKEITFTGTITSLYKVDLLPKMSGRVKEVNVREGKHVTKGQLLVKFEDEDLKAQLSQAYAALTAARARLAQAISGYDVTSSTTGLSVKVASQGIKQATEMTRQATSSFDNAKLEYDRMINLYDKGAVSKQTLDNITTQYEIATSRLEGAKAQEKQANDNYSIAKANTGQNNQREADVQQANAGIRQAEANIQYLEAMIAYTELRSPINGIVTFRNTEPGQIVGPGDKKPAITVTDNSTVYLEADIPEGQIAGLVNGMNVSVKVDSLKEKKFSGTIETVIPASDPLSHTFRIKVKMPNPGEVLKNGMAAWGSVFVARLNGIVIPRSWLKVIDGEFYVVMVDDNGKALHHKVIPSNYNEDEALIGEGMKAGDQIISTGQESLKDGDLVNIAGKDEYANQKSEVGGQKSESNEVVPETPPEGGENR
jgi:HlyD family secretion protein